MLFVNNAYAQEPINQDITRFPKSATENTYSYIPYQNYMDDSGQWKRHNLSFRHTANGFVYDANYRIAIDDSLRLIIFRYGNLSIRLRPLNINKTAGTFANKKVTFKNEWDSTDVNYELTTRGIKSYYILKNKAAPIQFRYGLEIRDGAAIDSSKADIKIIDTGNQAILPLNYYTDATGIQRQVKAKITEQSGNKILTVRIDTIGLTYPITLDPSTLIYGTTLITDAGIRASNMTTNYGTETTFDVYVDDINSTRRTEMKMDLSNILADSVTAFICSVNVTSNSVDAMNRNNWKLTLKRSLGTWTESAVTWNLQPWGYKNTSKRDTVRFNWCRNEGTGWFRFTQDTSATFRLWLQQWISYDSTNNGFIMMMDSAGYDSILTARSIRMTFASTEGAANQPRIWITTNNFAPCTLAIGDTNAVSMRIDSVRPLVFWRDTSKVRVSIFNSVFGKYYKIPSPASRSVWEMSDTLFQYSPINWRRANVPMKPNTKNYFIIKTTINGASFDTVRFQAKQVGSVSSGMSFTGRDSLWFVMYDTLNGIYKLIPVDSLLMWEPNLYANQYYANSFSLMPMNIVRLLDYVWRRPINIVDRN